MAQRTEGEKFDTKSNSTKTIKLHLNKRREKKKKITIPATNTLVPSKTNDYKINKKITLVIITITIQSKAIKTP